LTSIVVRRLLGVVFAATRYAIDPSPWPFDPDVITIHGAVFEAAHAQSRSELTVSVPAPPAAGTVSSELVTVTPQRVVVGAVTDVFEEVQEAARGGDDEENEEDEGAAAPGRTPSSYRSASAHPYHRGLTLVQVAYLMHGPNGRVFPQDRKIEDGSYSSRGRWLPSPAVSISNRRQAQQSRAVGGAKAFARTPPHLFSSSRQRFEVVRSSNWIEPRIARERPAAGQ
jgi:hypothetical protein